MRPCSPRSWLLSETGEETSSEKHWLIPQMRQSGETQFVLGFHLFGTSSMAELPEPLLQRLLCHALLHLLPDEGLPEAMQSLVDMNEFYRLPRFVPPPLPQKSIPVRIGPGYVRPVFPVTEEE